MGKVEAQMDLEQGISTELGLTGDAALAGGPWAVGWA